MIPSLFFLRCRHGIQSSIVRAAVMASVLLAGYFAERRVLVGNSLAAAAVLILCVDTQPLLSTGFQLSFAVVAAIICSRSRFPNGFPAGALPIHFLPAVLAPDPAALATQLALGCTRDFGFARSLDRIPSADHLVLQFDYADFGFCESRRCPARIFSSGGRFDVVDLCARDPGSRDYF